MTDLHIAEIDVAKLREIVITGIRQGAVLGYKIAAAEAADLGVSLPMAADCARLQAALKESTQ